MKYPGHVVKAGENYAQIVAALKHKLNEALAIENDAAQRLDPTNPNNWSEACSVAASTAFALSHPPRSWIGWKVVSAALNRLRSALTVESMPSSAMHPATRLKTHS